MADLGTDAGQATLNLSTKTLELLAKLLDKIFQFIANHPIRKKARLEYRMAKTDHDRKIALRKIDGKAGYISYKKMKATGRPLENARLKLSTEDMKLYADIAKRFDLTFTGLVNKKNDEIEIMVFRDDLEKANQVQARYVNECKLNTIQAKIDEFDAKGFDNLSDEEKKIYEGLKAEKEQKLDEMAEDFNEEMNESILKDAVLDEDGNLKKMDLEEGLNRLTGYNLSKPDSGDFVIADAVNPGNYIKVHGFDDSFKTEDGREVNYVRSQYEVYKNNELVKAFDDKRYVGRPKGYWASIRNEMNNLLDKPKYFFKFKTEDVYKVWAEDVVRQNEQELNNYTIDSIKEELQSKGFDYKDGNVVLAHSEVAKDGNVIPEGQAIDKDFIKKVIGQSNLTTMEQKLDFKEAFLASQTIESLENINELEKQLGTKNAEIAVEDVPDVKASLEKEYTELENKLNAEKHNIEAIVMERKKVNAAQAQRNVFNNKDKNKNHTRDESREEHLKENEETFVQQTFDEWRDTINKERVEQAAKDNDMGTKGQSMEHTKAVKETAEKAADKVR